jgi:NAD(P)-dependent dehydrogenase (short-subunit alcohol dehydrogenase family)
MTGRLVGKVALVTGAGSGIGRASACAFAMEGARVVVADVDADGGEETVRQIEGAGGEAIFVRADVTRAADVEALVDRAVATYGRLDCAHNNAGIYGALAPIAEYPEEVWDQVIAVNLKGVWLCLKYEVAAMLKQGGGAIVNSASVAGLVGAGRGSSAYFASKHGVVGLTKDIALECATKGIRVNAVCPGVIPTPLAERAFGTGPEVEAGLRARHPMDRMGTVEEVAEAVVYLCSDAAGFITGHALPIDGGWSAA